MDCLRRPVFVVGWLACLLTASGWGAPAAQGSDEVTGKGKAAAASGNRGDHQNAPPGGVFPLEVVNAALPTLIGELAGRVLALSGAPSLDWRVRLGEQGPHSSGRITARITVSGEGTRVEAETCLAPVGVTWRIAEAVVELEAWREAASRKRPELAGWTVAGRLRAEGEGTWRDGAPAGWLRLRLEQGRLESAARKLAIEGIEADVRISDLGARTTAQGQWLAWKGGRADTLSFGSGRVDFSLDAGTLVVADSVLELLGGRVRVAPFRLRPDQSLNSLDASAEEIEVSLLLPLLPPVLAEAEGRLNGSLRLVRNATGMSLAEARLGLPAGKPARIRLLPTPGIISNNLPPRVLQHYPGLRRIETGEMPMRADTMEILLAPQEDAARKSATVRLEGGPLDPTLKAPLIFDVNVYGPLQPLIRFGTDERLRFGK